MDEMVKTHRDLDLWKVSLDLVENIYLVTKNFPADEKFGLANQLRRAAVSICSNIAEGAGRNHTKEYIQFLYYSLGSVAEIEAQLEIAVRLKFINHSENLINQIIRVRKMISALIFALKAKK